jgi:hypothetical protein
VWEERSLLFVVVGILVLFVNEPAGLVIAGLGAVVLLIMVRSICTSGHKVPPGFLPCVVTFEVVLQFALLISISHLFLPDTTFSIFVTALFLRPIYKVLREGDGVARLSAGYKSLQKTKWMTLSGACLAVFSSSVLYINLLLFFTLGAPGKPFYTNPYLNIFVFGLNLDSVLNDVGMLLACGVLKTASCTSLSQHFTTAAPSEVMPEVQPVFDSQAYERDETVHILPLSLGSSDGSWVSSDEKHLGSGEHPARKCGALRPPMEDSKMQNEPSTDRSDTEIVKTKVQKMPAMDRNFESLTPQELARSKSTSQMR